MDLKPIIQQCRQDIELIRDTEWEKLKNAKFSNNTPEEIEIMKTIWNHGFCNGVTASLGVSQKLIKH